NIGLCYEGLLKWIKAHEIYSQIIKEYDVDNGQQAKDRLDFIEKYHLCELEKKNANGELDEDTYFTKIGISLIESWEDLNKAKVLLEKAYKLNPENLETLFWLGVAYNYEADQRLHYAEEKKEIQRIEVYKQKAWHIFKKIVRDSTNSKFADKAQYKLGEYYADSTTVWDNDYKQAIREYKKIIEKYPDSELCSNAQLKIGDCYRWLDDYHQAIKEYERVIEDYPATQETIIAQRSIGISYGALKDYEKAIDAYQKILNKFPKTQEAGLALLDISEVYKENLKDYNKAIEAYEEYIANYAKRKIDQEVYQEEINRLKVKAKK
ncbi:MAG: tetratricopeptide repeat protein, partial [bacterium]|nr:tetratricopeptide repeat protein [bacterium]